MAGNFRFLLSKALSEMGVRAGIAEMDRFDRFRDILLLWNEKMNLVSIQSETDLPVRHFADSLTLLPHLPAGPHTLIDIGSGAGFPAVPLKIMRPDLRMTLLESSRKKCSFLKEVGRQLALTDLAVLNTRVEDLSLPEGERFELLVSRATFKLPKLLECGLPLLKAGGLLIAMKGPEAETEIEASKSEFNDIIQRLGIINLSLPLTGDRRRILLVDKPS